MKIIKATKNEIDQVAGLFNDYRIFYDQKPDVKGAKKFILERIKKKESVIFLAIDDNKKGLGFIQLYPSFTSIGMNRIWVLNDLYVDIMHRKNRIAEKLIEVSKEFVKESGASGLVLETQNENHPAQKLYFKTGFIKDSMHSYFFWKSN